MSHEKDSVKKMLPRNEKTKEFLQKNEKKWALK